MSSPVSKHGHSFGVVPGKSRCQKYHLIGESRIVRLNKVLYLCTVIVNYSNFGTRQETIKQQAKVRRGRNR